MASKRDLLVEIINEQVAAQSERILGYDSNFLLVFVADVLDRERDNLMRRTSIQKEIDDKAEEIAKAILKANGRRA